MKYIKDLNENESTEMVNISVEDLTKAFQDLASDCIASDGTIDSPAKAFKWIESKVKELKTK